MNFNDNARYFLNDVYLFIIGIFCIAVAFISNTLFLDSVSLIFILFAIVVFTYLIIKFILISKIYSTNITVAFYILVSYYRLNQQFKNADLLEMRHNKRYVRCVPKIFFKVNSNGTIYLYVQNSIRNNKSLSKLDIMPGLFKLVILRKYLSEDHRYYIFELYIGQLKQSVFSSIHEFVAYIKKISSDYEISLDSNNKIKFGHLLISGKTGSGKTYALLSILMQLMIKHSNVSIVDYKNSDLSIAASLSKIQFANNSTDSIVLMQQFLDDMNKRKQEIQELSYGKIGLDFESLNLKSHYLIIDEYSALIYALSKEQKIECMNVLNQIILQGRQLGFFVILSMQQANASLIPTNLRDQFQFRCVMGNSEKMTYQVVFSDYNEEDFYMQKKTGQALYTMDNILGNRLCFFPFFEFDLGEQISLLSKLQ